MIFVRRKLDTTQPQPSESTLARSPQSRLPGESSATLNDQKLDKAARVRGRRREMLPCRMTTLGVPGSLYVGKGLGIRKTETWLPRGGTARQLLDNILLTCHPDDRTPLDPDLDDSLE